jgi:pimeloyl-ACP methyl ester carboxylesterase
MEGHDGVTLRYRCSVASENRPWLVFVIPFGLSIEIADAFFDYFANKLNVVAWESRLILSLQDRKLSKQDFALENHARDLLSIADVMSIDNAILVGYCSGAGVALAAANLRPEKFQRLVLVHGEFVFLKDDSCMTQVGKDIDSILPIASKGEDKAQLILDRVASLQQRRGADLPAHLDINLPFSNRRYLHRYALNYLAYRESDFESLARGIDVQTLVMAGDADKQTCVASASRIGRTLRQARIFVDANADHYGVVRNRSNTLQEIDRFIGTA